MMTHQLTRPTKAMRTLGWMGLRLDSELGALGLQLLADRASGFRPVSGPTISARGARPRGCPALRRPHGHRPAHRSSRPPHRNIHPHSNSATEFTIFRVD